MVEMHFIMLIIIMGFFGSAIVMGIIWRSAILIWMGAFILLLAMIPLETIVIDSSVQYYPIENIEYSLSAPTVSVETLYNVSAGGGDSNLNTQVDRNGIKFTASSSLVGDTFDTWVVKLKKVGAPPAGSISATFRNSGDTVVATASNTVSIASLTTSYVEHTFTFASPVVITSNSRLLVEYALGDASNTVVISRTTSDAFDGVNTHIGPRVSGSYNDASTSIDVTGRISLATSQVELVRTVTTIDYEEMYASNAAAIDLNIRLVVLAFAVVVGIFGFVAYKGW